MHGRHSRDFFRKSLASDRPIGILMMSMNDRCTICFALHNGLIGLGTLLLRR